MNCEKVKKNLTEGLVPEGKTLEEHLNECTACARFAERLAIVHEALEDHHAGVRPDPAFAARVVARLPRQSPVLGWAALRLLPAATALLLVLSAWVFLATGTPTELVAAAPTDDLLSWVLENGETGE
jgi:anti-sigma factor RsiW